MRNCKVGILGTGVISRTYAGDIKQFYKKLEIDACADINKDAASKLSSEYGIPRVLSVDEILNDPSIDIIINLTPPQFHVELSKKILNAGKHLFSEKPFAANLEDARSILELAKEKNLFVGCAPDTFLSSGLQSVRHYLDDNLIGKPFFVTANMTTFGVETWHRNPRAFYMKTAGPIYDMAPYYISAIVSLLGPIDSITALSCKGQEVRHIYVGPDEGKELVPETDTHYSAVMRLKSGAVVNLNVSFDIYRSNLPMFEIYGSDGTLTYPDPNFGGGSPKIYRKEQFTDTVYNKSEDAVKRSESFVTLPELFPRVKDYSRGIGVLDLADAIEKGRTPRTSGDFILHVTEALEGIIKSADNNETYKMTTTCERPEPIKPGTDVGEI